MTAVQPPPPSGPPTSSEKKEFAPAPLAPAVLLPERDEDPALRWRELALLLVAGYLFNISMRAGLDNIAVVLVVVVLAATLLFGGRVDRRLPQLLVLAGLALSPWLYFRSSTGLTVVTIAAIAGLFMLAVGLSREGDLFDLRARAIAAHGLSHLVEWAYGLSMLKRLLHRNAGGRNFGAIARGASLAVPVVAIFALLLASADEVFASVLLVDNTASLVGHVVASLALAVGFLGLVSRAAYRTSPYEKGPKRVLSSVEVNVVLGSLAALFAAFVGTQIVVALGGVDHVLETEGLTRAQHARSGFFQLLWVAALTLALLGAIRATRSKDVDAGVDRFRPLALVILGLTLVITAISIQRLLLYVEAFGLTPLRFWSLATAGWIGALIVGYALSTLGVGDRRSWFPAFLVISAACFVLALNVLNPDAFVVRHNLTNPPAERSIDTEAIATLSDDAVQEALDNLNRIPPESQLALSEQLCRRPDLEARFGLLGANRAERSADSLLDNFCVERLPAHQ